jgi:trehalose-6-phosphate hydrolase
VISPPFGSGTTDRLASLHKDSADEALKATLKDEYQRKSRDNARTPMQWTAGPNAGFTDAGVKPWMRVHPNHTEINAEAQTGDKSSVYHAWRAVLETRKKHLDVFVYGDFGLVEPDHPQVIAYSRTAADGTTAVVAANFSAETVEWNGLAGTSVGEVLASNAGKTAEIIGNGSKLTLGPYEGLVVLLKA